MSFKEPFSSETDLTSPTTHSPTIFTSDIMSPPNPQRTLGASSRTPSLPNSAASTPIEPKSDYLRHMLESKRAQQAMSSAPAPAPAPKSKVQPAESTTLRNASSDPWLDQARSEDETARSTPVRRARRPSDGGVPRMRTQRELQTETEKLKDALFNLNLKLDLISKQNNKLKDQMEEAEARIQELEPLEDDNFELKEENQRLILKLENMAEEAVQLRDQNMVILKIQEESIDHMDKQNSALQEAADMIVRLEKEKAVLAQENAQLSDQLAEAQSSRISSSGAYPNALDGTTKYPVRVHSIDESRPSTSHFDSDYYSQPASPQVKVSDDSLDDIALSDRTKNFLSMKRDNHKSTQDLKKRLSDASVKGVRLPSPAPAVPPIPPCFQGQSQDPPQPPPQQPPHDPQIAATRTPRRIRPRQHLSPSAMAQAQAQPIRPATAGPRTPTTESKAGLRAMYRGNLTVDTKSHGAPQASPSYNSPLALRPARKTRLSQQPQQPQTTPVDRFISKQPKPRSSRTQLHDLARETLGAPDSPEEDQAEWPSPPIPSPSCISDLTTEPDLREEWWRGVGRHLQQVSSARASAPPQKDFALSIALAGAQPTRRPSGHAGHARGASVSSQLDAPPPYMGMQDFLFNPAESEDDFLRRASSFRTKR